MTVGPAAPSDPSLLTGRSACCCFLVVPQVDNNTRVWDFGANPRE